MFEAGSILQFVVGIFMSVATLGTQLHCMPYKTDKENRLAVAAHVLVFLTFFTGLIGKLDPSTFKGYDAQVRE